MKIQLTYLLFLTFILSAQAEEQVQSAGRNEDLHKAPSICTDGKEGVIKASKPLTQPNYFFRTFNRNGREYVSYAGDQGKLYLHDLNTGKSHEFKGDFDPVPLNSDIMSTPDMMTFRKIEEIEKGNTSPKPIEVTNDYAFKGVYQSVGKIKETTKSKTYRVITDELGATAADYEVNGMDITMVSQPKAICRNVAFKLPMLSKDGSMISGFDVRTNTTKIWKIKNNGTCDEIFDLGIGVGKADFSPDNKKIVFHSITTDKTDYFQKADENPTGMNVYYYDLEKKNLKQMTHNYGKENSYYPVFREDGSIVYGSVAETGTTFVHADPDKVKGTFFDPKGLNNLAQIQLELMGQTWTKMCSGTWSGNRSSSLSVMASMKPEQCHEFVDKYWKDASQKLYEYLKSEKYKDIDQFWDQKALHAACDKNWDAFPKTEYTLRKELHEGAEIMAKKCSICHEIFGANYLQSFTNLPADFTKKIRNRILSTGPDRMPQSGTLSDEEKEKIISFINSVTAKE